METKRFDNEVENQWCPGCSNFGILKALKTTLSELGKRPDEVCIVSGIGQAAKLPHYLNCDFFNGLHGRAIPVATGIHAANPELTTLVVTGDGDCYGEGGNHFLHMMRRNPDICVIIHNNELYALTKGQASPTTPLGEKRTLPAGLVENRPLNMLGVAIIHDTGFVARGFAGQIDHLAGLFKEGISHKGLSIIEVIQPCITWGGQPASRYKERVRELDDNYDAGDRLAAMETVLHEKGTVPVGVLYRGSQRPVFAERYRTQVSDRPMYEFVSTDDAVMMNTLNRYKSA